MKLPDTDHLILCRVALTDLMASQSSDAPTFNRAGTFLELIKQQGFNAIIVECSGLTERWQQSAGDGMAEASLLSDNNIRGIVSSAHRLALRVVLVVEDRGAAPSPDGVPPMPAWHQRADAILTRNRNHYGADGIWFRRAREADRHPEPGGHGESPPNDWRTVADRYPDTWLIVDPDSVARTRHRAGRDLPPNVIIRNPSLDGLPGHWRRGGAESIGNLDGLAAALVGDEPVLHEDVGQAGSEPAVGRRLNLIVDEPQAGLLQTSQASALDEVLTALVLTAPGIPAVCRSGGESAVAALLRLRQSQQAIRGGLQGNHIRIIHKNDAGKVLAYLRWSRDARRDGVMVLINFSDEGWRDYTLGLPMDSNWQLQLHSKANDGEEPSLQFSEEQYFPEPASLTLDLTPYSFLVFTRAG